MLTYEQASSKVLEGRKSMLIMDAYEAPQRFIFTLQPMKGEPLMDSIFEVNKSTGKVSEYAIFNHIDEWKKVSKNPIYQRKSSISDSRR